MAVNNDSAVIKLSIKYINDGQSLDQAIAAAKKKVYENAKKSGVSLNAMDRHVTAEQEAKLRQAVLAHSKAQKQILSSYQKFTAQLTNMGQKVGKVIGYAAASAAVYGLIAAFTGAISTMVKLEKAFTSLQAKSGFTSKEMGKVQESILAVASASEFGTEALTNTATAMAKLGFEATNVVDILPTVARVAQAAGENLETTAQAMGAIMNTFGMKGGGEAAAINVGDRLISAFTQSALDLTKFNTAFGYTGAIAKQTGTSFTELTAAMEIMADRGVTASKMGTGLRNIFIKLNEEGSSLEDILRQVNEQNLSFVETVELVGTRGATAISILGDEYVEFTDKVTGANEEFGRAMERAAIQQTSIAAKWEILMNNIKNIFVSDDFYESGDDPDAYKKNLRLGIVQNELEAMNVHIEGSTAVYKRLAKEFVYANKSFRDAYTEADELYDGVEKNIFKNIGINPDTQGVTGNVLGQALLAEGAAAMDDYNAALAKSLLETDMASWEKAMTNELADIRNDRSSEAMMEELNRQYLELKMSIFTGQDIDGTKQRKLDFLDTQRLKGDQTATWIDVLRADLKFKRKAADAMELKGNGGAAGVRNVDKAAYDRHIADILAGNKKVCDDLGPVQARLLEFNCPDKTKTKAPTYDRDYFQASPEKRRQFDKESKGLMGAYKAETDPIIKARINDALLKVQVDYYDDLLKEQQAYLDKKILQAEKASSKAEKKGVAAEINDVERQTTSTLGKKESAQAVNAARVYKYKEQAYKKEQTQYAFHVAVMNDLYDKMEMAETPEERAYASTQMLDENTRYYSGVEANMEEHLAYLRRLKDQLIADNLSTEGVDSDIANALLGIRTNSSNKAGSDATVLSTSQKYKDADQQEKVEIAAFALNSMAQLYDIRKAHTDRMIEEAQRQSQGEIDAVNELFDAEAKARNGALEAGIISQEDATKAEIRAEKRKQDKLNAIAEKQFEIEKKARIESLIIDGIIGAAQAAIAAFSSAQWWMAPVAGGLALAASASAVAAESRRQYVPQTFAEGGLVSGASHAAGGVPFSVQGRGGYEMEGGEYIVNKKAVSDNFALLEAINGRTKNQKHFATGGYVPAESNTPGTDLNAAILEAVNRPVRAWVTNQDLTESESERRALESKTTY